MSQPASPRQHQEERARLAMATARAAGKLWRRLDRDDMRSSWEQLLPELLLIVTGAQRAAASSTDPYLQRLLGDDPDRAESDQLDPQALAGTAPDGRSLVSLLMYPLWATLGALARGASVAFAWASGAAVLDLLIRTVIADTGRAADLIGMIVRPAITSYVRVVELPACARCIVLASREYTLTTGFQRHPRCDCTMAPVTRTFTPTVTSAKQVFAQMTDAQRHKAFGAATVKAIGDGADIEQVVNARRGMTTATYYRRTVQTTTEGITRRGIAGSRSKKFQRVAGNRYSTAKSPRLMPEEIYRLAEGDREHAIRLLRRHAYIV
ncbi:hypothetical protein ABZ069_23195 [Streptomyces microflavus]|uniref:hypothetical protein n=1 Tax=Streptomyces microflavus TaxID=1919 RepID=UPI0033B57555